MRGKRGKGARGRKGENWMLKGERKYTRREGEEDAPRWTFFLTGEKAGLGLDGKNTSG